MPINLELKIKLDSFTEIKSLLKKINAEQIGLLRQKDIYYKSSSGLLKLRVENGGQSIIKYLRDEKSKDRFSNFEVIHFKDGEGEKFFNDLLKIEAVVEKKRLLFMFNNTRVHLDSVKNLGNFLELETLVLFGKLDAQKRFKEINSLLKLEKYQQIKMSYRDLIMESKKNDTDKK